MCILLQCSGLWLKDLDLGMVDKLALREDMLTDKHMHAAMKILQKQFFHVQSLQSTLLAQSIDTRFIPVKIDTTTSIQG